MNNLSFSWRYGDVFHQWVICLIFMCISLGGFAQKAKMISVGVGANAYRGDLSTNLAKWTPIYHLGFKFNSEKKLNGNINLGIGHVTGNNESYSFDDGEIPSPSPNRFFRTSVFLLNYELNYNFVTWRNLRLYISQGIGLFRFNPQDEFFDDLQDQPQTRADGETYSNITIQLPTQLGLLYQLKNGFALGFQSGFISPLTDYIDNISDWGTKGGFDNILTTRFSFYVPLGTTANN